MTGYRFALALCGIFTLLVAGTFAEVVQFAQCKYEKGKELNTKCIVHEVRVNPCEEAAEGKACRLKRGKNATIEFDYTASFAADTLKSEAFWSSLIDIPFMGLEPNACLSTPCPMVTGQRQSYHMDLPIMKQYPLRTYDVKWKVKSPQEEECCFIFKIKIEK